MNGRAFAALAGQESIIVIRRPFVAWLGHVSDALLMDQLIYWQDAAGAGEWFPMGDASLAAHLCLSEYEISQARARLVASGMVEAARLGIPARMHYRLDVGSAFAAFAAFVGVVDNALHVPENAATSSPNSPDWRGDSEEHTIYKVNKGINGENENQKINGTAHNAAADAGQSAATRRRGRPRKVQAAATDSPPELGKVGKLRGNWPDFRARVLADYGAIGTKANHALVSNIARTAAEAHGLAEPQALAAWSEFWSGLSDAELKYIPLPSAANRFGQWLKKTIADRRRKGG